jgi:hypothetical protein
VQPVGIWWAIPEPGTSRNRCTLCAPCCKIQPTTPTNANRPTTNANRPTANRPTTNANHPNANRPTTNANRPTANRPTTNANRPTANRPTANRPTTNANHPNANRPTANRPTTNANHPNANRPTTNANHPNANRPTTHRHQEETMANENIQIHTNGKRCRAYNVFYGAEWFHTLRRIGKTPFRIERLPPRGCRVPIRRRAGVKNAYAYKNQLLRYARIYICLPLQKPRIMQTAKFTVLSQRKRILFIMAQP